MILEIFIVFMVIAILLVIMGYYMGMTELSVVGFVFLFLLSAFVLIPGRLQYKVGESVVNHPACFSCNNNLTVLYSPDNRSEIIGYQIGTGNNDTFSYVASSETINEYATFNDQTAHYFGYFMSIISALGMIFVIIRMVYGENY